MKIKNRFNGELLLEIETLTDANLGDADLRNSSLINADLAGADLRYADLTDADLRYADLRYANLRYADLTGADLRGADLRDAKIDFNNCLSFQKTRILPYGDIVGWKKAKNGVIVKILIPKDAKRSQAFSRKCRAEYAEVLEIEGANTATSIYDSTFKYEVGDILKPTKPFDDNWQNECSSGIHFYITKLEAINH